MIKTVIDIGSNSTKYLCIDTAYHPYNILAYKSLANRIADSFKLSHTFDKKTIDNTLSTLSLIKKETQIFGCKNYLTVATMAFRKAENAKVLCDLIKNELGLQIKILSSDEEALLSFKSASDKMLDAKKVYLTLNIGGGSTELIFSQNMNIIKQISFDFGAVILKNTFFNLTSSLLSIQQCQTYVRSQLFILKDLNAEVCIAQGGVITNLLKIINTSQDYSFTKFDSQLIAYRQIIDLLTPDLDKLSYLSASHKDLLLPGLIILSEILRYFNLTYLTNNEKGICFSLLETF